MEIDQAEKAWKLELDLIPFLLIEGRKRLVPKRTPDELAMTVKEQHEFKMENQPKYREQVKWIA